MRKAKNKEYVWLNNKGEKLPMEGMEPEHIIKAHRRACVKELEFFNKSGVYSELRDQLEEIAEKRGITVLHPDETPDAFKYGAYFKNIRKGKARLSNNPNPDEIKQTEQVKKEDAVLVDKKPTKTKKKVLQKGPISDS